MARVVQAQTEDVLAGTRNWRVPTDVFEALNGATQPPNTFRRYNTPAGGTPTSRQSYDWLVHLDRQLSSPMELLYVSGYKPHELTQTFKYNTSDPLGVYWSHTARWAAEKLS